MGYYKFYAFVIDLNFHNTKEVTSSAPLSLRKRKYFDNIAYTRGGFVWCDRPFSLVKQPKKKWACDFHDNAMPCPCQVAEDFFKSHNFFIMEK